MKAEEFKEIANALTEPSPRGDWTDEYFASMTCGKFFQRHMNDNFEKQWSFIVTWLDFLEEKFNTREKFLNLPHLSVVSNAFKQVVLIKDVLGSSELEGSCLLSVYRYIVSYSVEYHIRLREILLVCLKNNHGNLRARMLQDSDDAVQISSALGMPMKEIEHFETFSYRIDALIGGPGLIETRSLRSGERESVFVGLYLLTIAL